MNRWQPLFTVACEHDYFAGGICTPIALTPSDDSARLMSQYGLLFRQRPGGATVYFNDASLLAQFDSPEPFSFWLSCTDPSLLNYTALDLSALSDDNGKDLAAYLFYADNRSDPNGALLPAFGSSAILRKQARFVWQFDNPVVSAQMVVQDALRGMAVWQMQTPPQPCTSVTIDLNALPSGCYTLMVNGTAVLLFYLCALPRKAASPALGVVAIYPGGSTQTPYLQNGCAALDDAGKVTPRTYALAMQARATVWRYHVFSQSADPHKYDYWDVTGVPARGDGTLAFTRSTPAGPGQPWLFQSETTIALAQTPGTFSFRLQPGVNESGGRVPGAIVKLPYAQGGLLVQPDKANPLNGFSDIYVYL